MKVLVIPDVHLKPRMFERAAVLMRAGRAERAVCLMDLPDNWDQELNIDLYIRTFDSAIGFHIEFPDTLWCYGNHDLSYLWNRGESGFSVYAWQTVNEKMRELQNVIGPEQLAFIHRIDDVLFLHGGLTQDFVKYYAPGVDPGDTDAVIERVNSLGSNEMWLEISPIWHRPQHSDRALYRPDDLLQVVGHTPSESIRREGNVISCDVFSTYSDGCPIGTEEYLIIDTKTWEFSRLG